MLPEPPHAQSLSTPLVAGTYGGMERSPKKVPQPIPTPGEAQQEEHQDAQPNKRHEAQPAVQQENQQEAQQESPNSSSPLSPIISHEPQAVNESDGHIYPVAWHYGQPLVEQSSLSTQHPGVVDRWDRVALHISGSQAHTWLNEIISQKVNAIQPGQATWGLVLDLQGRVLHYFGISCLDDASLLLDVPTDEADALQKYLTQMVFWNKVTVTRLNLAQLSVLGASWKDAGATGADEAGGDTQGSFRTRMLGDLPVIDYWVPREDILQQWDQQRTHAAPTGLMAYSALRIMARQPERAWDVDERTIPHEVAAFIGEGTVEATQKEKEEDGPTRYAVHLNKGCYRGQETVSRVQNLGRSPRIMVLIHLDGSAHRLPETGSAVLAGSKPVGRLGMAVHDADYGPIALGLIKRSVVDKLAANPDSVPALTVDGVDARIDPDDITADDAPRPGRAAVSALRQK